MLIFQISKKGIDHNMAKLTEQQVLDIRKKLESGITAYKISKELNFPYPTISDIKLRKTWRHI